MAVAQPSCGGRAPRQWQQAWRITYGRSRKCCSIVCRRGRNLKRG